MILRLTLAIAALCDLDHQRLHGTQLMIQECKQTVVELMKDIPSDLHTGVAEYMEKKRA